MLLALGTAEEVIPEDLAGRVLDEADRGVASHQCEQSLPERSAAALEPLHRVVREVELAADGRGLTPNEPVELLLSLLRKRHESLLSSKPTRHSLAGVRVLPSKVVGQNECLKN